jgi:hypothetical protein
MSSRETPPATADHVIGSFPRDALNSALASTHRAGFGPQTRVLDGVRGDAARQLERAGLRVVAGETPSADALLIVVTAPGRTGIVAELFARLGAEFVSYAARRDVSEPIQANLPLLTPDIRLGDDSGSAPEV